MKPSIRLPRLSHLALAVLGFAPLLACGQNGDLEPRYVHLDYVIEAEDARQLAGFADDVFIGRVRSVTGLLQDPSVPMSQFEVQVENRFKGSLASTVTVEQEGGFSIAENRDVLVEGDELLEPGRRYLFATKQSPNGMHRLVPIFGKIEIENGRHRAELVRTFQDAVKNQIPFDPSAP